MSNRPKPTFNGQCSNVCIAVLEEKDLIAILNSDWEIIIKRISDKKTVYQKQFNYANKICFIGINLIIYSESEFTLLDWEKDEILKKGEGFVFSNLQFYLFYQNQIFQLISLLDDQVHWSKEIREVNRFSGKMTSGFLFLKISFKNSIEFQLWDLEHNKIIDFKDCIKKEINVTINNYLLADSQFINDGKEILIEQFLFNCWRVIVFSLESFKVIENLILEKDSELPRQSENRIFSYKNHIYFLYDEKQFMQYDKKTKRLNSISLKFKKSNYINTFYFDENTGIVYLFGQNETLTLQLDSGLEFLINFNLPFRNGDSTLFSNFIMYAETSFSGSLLKVDLKINEYKIICYASDEIRCSQVLNNKILNLASDNSAIIWDFNTNKIVKSKKFKVRKYGDLILKELPSSYNKFRFEFTNYSDKSIKQSDYDDKLNLNSTNDLPNYKISREYSLETDDDRLIIHSDNKTIEFHNATTHWIIEAPEFFESGSSARVCQKTPDGHVYIAKGALYKINLANGDLTKGIVFRQDIDEYDCVNYMQISNKYLFLGMEGFWIFIIDLEKFELIHKISTTHESTHSLVFCPKRNFLLVASYYRPKITIFDVLTGKEVHSWQAHKSSLSKLFYLKDQNALLSVCNNGSMRKWDYNTFKLLDEYYSLPAMPDKKYRKGWAHIDRNSKLRGSIHHKEYFDVSKHH